MAIEAFNYLLKEQAFSQVEIIKNRKYIDEI